MKKLVIERSKWLSPVTVGNNFPMYNSKKACCLGHACHKLFGVPWAKMKDGIIGDPEDLQRIYEEQFDLGFLYNKRSHRNTKFSNKAIGINDNESLSREEKEKQLISLFATKDVELTFVD